MSQKPTLQEWLKENPGKGINEYFKLYPEAQIKQEQSHPIYQHYPIISQPPIDQGASQERDLGNIIVSIMILISFVLPWINIRLLNLIQIVSSSGYDMPRILTIATGGAVSGILTTIYLIPLGAFLSLIGETSKSGGIRVTGQVIMLCIFIYWFFLIKHLVFLYSSQTGLYLNFWKITSYGFYLTGIGGVFYAIDLTRGILGER